MKKETQDRIISAIFLGLISIAFLASEPLTQVIFIGFIATVVAWEVHFNFLKKESSNLWPIFLLIMGMTFISLGKLNWWVVSVVLHFIFFVLLLYKPRPRKKVRRFILPYPVFLGIGFSPWFSYLFYEGNIDRLIYFICSVAAMDIGAWFFGRKFGKTVILPALSPKKTWEGFFGGLFASILVSLVFYFFFPNFKSFVWLIVGPFFSGLSHVGDFFQSFLKRSVMIKDSSAIIPGHGGVFDRIDGLYFAFPFFYAVLQCM